MLAAGIPIEAGTDSTRIASYNPGCPCHEHGDQRGQSRQLHDGARRQRGPAEPGDQARGGQRADEEQQRHRDDRQAALQRVVVQPILDGQGEDKHERAEPEAEEQHHDQAAGHRRQQQQ